jgi:hypothetical protein|tara:strand:+ start:1264 stop:1548 length:285 start_codon:yes stop_codon:yes gene_type:complete
MADSMFYVRRGSRQTPVEVCFRSDSSYDLVVVPLTIKQHLRLVSDLAGQLAIDLPMLAVEPNMAKELNDAKEATSREERSSHQENLDRIWKTQQ